MWRLVGEGHIAAAREAIAARQAAEAGWSAPEDLLDRLALAEMRGRLVNASDAKQYGTVIQIADREPGLRTCGDVDVSGASPRRSPERAVEAGPPMSIATS